MGGIFYQGSGLASAIGGLDKSNERVVFCKKNIWDTHEIILADEARFSFPHFVSVLDLPLASSSHFLGHFHMSQICLRLCSPSRTMKIPIGICSR